VPCKTKKSTEILKKRKRTQRQLFGAEADFSQFLQLHFYFSAGRPQKFDPTF
jgi:hypothetical protein